MGYLTNKYKGTYRIKVPYDTSTNQFPRDLKGNYEDIDCYIDCAKNVKVFYYGRSILQAYIPSITYGRNIIRMIYSEYINPNNTNKEEKPFTIKGIETTKTTYAIIDKDLFKKDLHKKDSLIFDIEETDQEVLFKFKSNSDKIILPLLKPKTSGASISPFSSKNLPKNKDYKIPDGELNTYKQIISNLPQNQLILIGKYTTNFIKTLETKNTTWEDIKSDMAKKCLKGKEYVHSIGKWNEYLEYLKENL